MKTVELVLRIRDSEKGVISEVVRTLKAKWSYDSVATEEVELPPTTGEMNTMEALYKIFGGAFARAVTDELAPMLAELLWTAQGKPKS